MLSQPELPVQVNVQVDNKYLDERMKDYIKEYCETFLRPQWLTIAHMEKITRRKRAWIMDYIVYDPYVKRNKLAKKDNGGQWLFDADGIRPFLKRLFNDLPDY